MIRFLKDCPALFISDIKTLVISDLHIGLEHDLYTRGIIIPAQAEKFSKIIEKLIKQTGANRLVILGDVKYEVPGMSFRELKEIPKILENLKKKVKVIITKGNHDTYLEQILPKGVKLHSSRGFRIKKYGFFHGHAWPSKKLMQCDYLFMGHIQPAIEFRDKLGYRSVHQVWVVSQLNSEVIKKKHRIKKTGKLNLTIVPSFNELSGYLVLNKELKENLTGPLFSSKAVDIEKSKIYFIDGTYLGKLENLKMNL